MCSHSVYFWVIWTISSGLGMLYQQKSGDPVTDPRKQGRGSPVADGGLSGRPDDEEGLVVEAEGVPPPSAVADEEGAERLPELVGHGVVQDRIDGAAAEKLQ